MYKLPFLTMTVYRYTWDNYLKNCSTRKTDLSNATWHLVHYPTTWCSRAELAVPVHAHSTNCIHTIRFLEINKHTVIILFTHIISSSLRNQKAWADENWFIHSFFKRKTLWSIPLICTMYMFCTFLLTYEKLHKFSSWQGLWHTSAFCVDCILALHLHHVCKLLSYKKYW